MAVEFWLSFNNQAEVLALPVVPSDFQITKGNQINTINVNNLGEVGLIGKGTLARISIYTFFPNQVYPFCSYSTFPEPYECVDLIERWKESGRPMRLIITSGNARKEAINMAFSIENFSYGERDGTGDVYFTLDLTEYRFVKKKSLIEASTASGTNRPVESVAPTTYTTKAGDTLWDLAKKFYGTGSRYKELADKNGIKNPDLLPVGKALVI
jgi:nucleoid-associated protein YgaU